MVNPFKSHPRKLIAFIVLVCASCLYYTLGSIDADEPDYSHLYLENTALSADKINTLPLLTSVVNSAPPKSERPVILGDFEIDGDLCISSSNFILTTDTLSDWMEQTPLLYEALDAALARDYLHVPVNLDPASSSPIIATLDASKLLHYRAAHYLAQEKFDAFLGELNTIQRFAQLIPEGDPSLVAMLCYIAIQDQSLNLTHYAIDHYKDNSSFINSCKRFWHKHPIDIRETAKDAFKYEFLSFAYTIENLEKMAQRDDPSASYRKINNSFVFHRNRTIQRAIDHFDILIDLCDQSADKVEPYTSKFEAELKEFNKSYTKWVKPNFIGKALFAISSPIIARQINRMHMVENYRRLLLTKIACRQYSQQHGKLPTSLNDLNQLINPDYLIDLYSKDAAQHFHYDKETLRIWSNGYNCMNNGGTPPDDQRFSDYSTDAVFTL